MIPENYDQLSFLIATVCVVWIVFTGIVTVLAVANKIDLTTKFWVRITNLQMLLLVLSFAGGVIYIIYLTQWE